MQPLLNDFLAPRHRLLAGAVLVCVLAVLWLALAPLHPDSRERALDIAGKDELPRAITLTLGVQDVLLLRNGDKTAQRFGPLLLAPGQQFRLPFEQTGEFAVAAGAWPNGVLTVTVVEWPAPGWERVAWRVAAFIHAVRYLPKIAQPH